MLLPTVILLVIYHFAPLFLMPINATMLWVVLAVICLTTLLIPMLSVYIFKVTGSIDSVEMPQREERYRPFLFIAMFYAIAAYGFYGKLNTNIFILLATLATLILLLTLVTRFIKISAHATGMAGAVGILLAVSIRYPGSELLLPLIACILLTGLVSSARLRLKVHTGLDVGAGVLLGFLWCFSSILIFT